MNPRIVARRIWAGRTVPFFLALAALCVAAFSGYYWVLLGTQVLGINIGGMTLPRAIAVLGENLNWEEEAVILKTPAGSESAFFGKDLGIYPDLETTVLSTRRPIWALKQRDYPLYVKIEGSRLDTFIGGLVQKSLVKPEDAKFVVEDDGQVKTLPEKRGYAVDAEKAKSLLLKGFKWYEVTRQMEVPLFVKEPKVTESYLQGFLPFEIVASYSTQYQDRNDRAHNVQLAAQCFNNLTLWPGQTISFNDVVGPRTKDRGYRKAAVFFGDDVVDDYGGGVCQVSTTLYVAMLKAGCEVVERYNHGMPVSYVPLGLDATVAFDLLDLKMKNPFDAPFVLQSKAVDGVLTVSVLGKKQNGLTIEVESRVLKEVPALVDAGQGQKGQEGSGGATDGTVKPRSGYMVETLRKFIKEGKIIKTEKLNTSWYPPEKVKAVPKKGAS